MIPMVFCASFPPCPSEYSDAETNCNVRNVLSTPKGVERTNTHDTASTSTKARQNPSRGDRTIAAPVMPSPDHTMAPIPAFITPAPARPPISACELLEGSPNHQVNRFQQIAPIR